MRRIMERPARHRLGGLGSRASRGFGRARHRRGCVGWRRCRRGGRARAGEDEELLAEDVIAKSYENTAVPPTDSEALPRPQREEEEEEEPFDFPVDYTLWAVIGTDGATRTYDCAAAAFVV